LLVWLHVAGAVCLLGGTIAFCLMGLHRLFRGTGLRWLLAGAGLLVLTQFGLGLVTWVVKYGWPGWMERWEFAAAWTIPERTFLQSNLVTLHQVNGSLILACWTVIVFRIWRVSRPPEPAVVEERQLRRVATERRPVVG
jgi:cytochrome c oxidase assembly protein subunit 15